MLTKLIDFPMAPNPQMLKACVNPDGCHRRISKIVMIEGTMYEACFCHEWTASKYGRKIMYPCGFEQKIPLPQPNL